MVRMILIGIASFAMAAPLAADEGMYLLNQPPRKLLKDRYNFDLTDAWLERVQKASIRFNNGGSGSFVSPEGLAITNHHIGADAIQKLSTAKNDYYKNGFLAKSRQDELKCPDLELNVLQEMVDVTKEVQAVVKPGMSPADALAARKAIMAKIAKESQAKTGLRSDIVTLYHGGLYHLYRYKRYTDVRLVMAPEHSIASFGGDVDNFEYPRYDLDVAFFRVYENDQPAKTPFYFPVSPKGPSEGDLVFVSGHPGTTNRLETLDHLIHRRDWLLPYTLQMLRYREALLLQHAEKGPEQRRQAAKDLYPVANARKALTGQYQGLLTPSILAEKKLIEAKLRQPIEADPARLEALQKPWNRISSVFENAKFAQGWHLTKDLTSPSAEAGPYTMQKVALLVERGDAFDSRLFKIARHLVRLADEMPKDDGKRLPEYRSSALESLKFQLLSPAPIDLELERVKLAGSLAFLAENFGGGNPLVSKILNGKSPARLAAELINGTTVSDVAVRKKLLDGGLIGIQDSKDPLIVFVRDLDGIAREARQYMDQNDEKLTQAYANISKALFEKHGTEIPPDATFTLRLAFGVVKGYEEDGKKIPFTTTYAGAFERADEHKNKEPFEMPERWLALRKKLDLKTPFNFVATSDTIGGNSGSPVLNRAGELVGVNFDRNRHGLVRNFVYTEEQARHVSVHSRGILYALEQIYGAESLVKEVQATR